MSLENVIAAIDEEISRLSQAKQLLSGTTAPPTPIKPRRGRPPGTTKKTVVAKPKRTMSAAGRAKIAAAQKARWAKQNASK